MTYQDLAMAAERLKGRNSGDARTVARVAEALRRGVATDREIARAKRLAKGVLPRRPH